MPRPRRKLGRTYNLYLSDEVNDLIEKYKGNLSRSQFVEKAVIYYVSQLTENPKEEENGQQKNYNDKSNAPTGRGYRARSKVRDLGSRPVGVRGFESLPLH